MISILTRHKFASDLRFVQFCSYVVVFASENLTISGLSAAALANMGFGCVTQVGVVNVSIYLSGFLIGWCVININVFT